MPITPNIIQTAKQTVKAQVLMSRTDRLPDLAMIDPNSDPPTTGREFCGFRVIDADFDSGIMMQIRESA
jgi:hypothetical protein